MAAVSLSAIDKVATYDSYISLTMVTRVPATATIHSLTVRDASPRFGHLVSTCNAQAPPVPPRPAYVPYPGMTMTPSDIMHQQICYQGI